MSAKQLDTEKVNSHYIYSGDTVRPMAGNAMVSNHRLKTATYEVQFNPDSGYYLTIIPDMVVPSVIYGDTGKLAERVIKTYIDRGCNTGVLLEGEQGSGKTMIAKILSRAMAEMDMPTIVINKAFNGPAFNKFMASIDTPSMVFFDEFEKTYSRQEDKDAVLTFFDGVFDSNKLIICTVNNKSRISAHMLNRPGRLYYMVNYTRLSPDVIKEYCEKTLKDKKYVSHILTVANIYGGFNFDMLKALIEEMNRYNCNPKEALKYLNIVPSFTKFNTGVTYVGVGFNTGNNLIVDTSKEIPRGDHEYSQVVTVNPHNEELISDVRSFYENESLDMNKLKEIFIKSAVSNVGSGYPMSYSVDEDDIVSFNSDTGVTAYENNTINVKLTPVPTEMYKEWVKDAANAVIAYKENMKASGNDGNLANNSPNWKSAIPSGKIDSIHF